jgi:murein DD-endopeptidase MepM/ murein hydrolase activator NlpD
MQAQHDRFTLIVVGGETSPVRRMEITRKRIRHGVIAVTAAVALLVAGAVDYVRLRLDAVDVAAMRADTSRHVDELDSLHAKVGSLEDVFDGLAELERKIRVIANLPGAASGAEAGATDGRGGPEEPDPAALETPAAETPAEPESAAASAPADPGKLDEAALARVRTRARQLGEGLGMRREGLEDLIAGLEGKSDQLASTPSIWPTDGWVTSGYGYRTSPFTGRKKFHGGLDIAADFGTVILAPARGRVTFVGNRGPLGKAVVLDHGYGLRTTYGHTAKAYVKRGEVVERGAPIAAIGSTGRSTGPHLHYAVEREGRAVDPSDYILE